MIEGNPGEIAVVGGGLAGLTAAAFAARAGHRVTLFERAAKEGGRARSETRDGFVLNQGPHALYRGGAASQALADLGVELPGRPPRTDGYALRRGRRYRMPAGVGSLLTTGLLGAREKLEAGRVLAALGHLDPAPLAKIPLGEWLAAEVQGARVREMIAAIFRLSTYVNAPGLVSTGACVAELQQGSRAGLVYLDGGWQAMVDGLRAAAESAGVSIAAGTRVERVAPAAGAWGVTFAGGRTECFDAVVLATPPREAAAMAPGIPLLGDWAKAAIPAEAACLDVGLRRLPNPKGSFALGIDEPVYLQTHSRWARLAPEGAALVSVAEYLPAGEPHDAVASRLLLERALDLAQPGWRELVLFERFLPAMIAIPALAQAALGGFAGRPGPAVPGAPGLAVAGDWVGPEGRLADASFASGRAAGGLAAAHAGQGKGTDAAGG